MTKIAIRTRALSHAERMTVWVAVAAMFAVGPRAREPALTASDGGRDLRAAREQFPVPVTQKVAEFDDYLASTGRG